MSTDPTEAELRAYQDERDQASWDEPDHWSKLPPTTSFEEEDRRRNFVDLAPFD